MNLTETCGNCGGTGQVEVPDILRGGKRKVVCANCCHTGGQVPSAEGLALLKFIKDFQHWKPCDWSKV